MDTTLLVQKYVNKHQKNRETIDCFENNKFLKYSNRTRSKYKIIINRVHINDIFKLVYPEIKDPQLERSAKFNIRVHLEKLNQDGVTD